MSTRLRIRFSKLGKVRFTSHRDLARMWERAFRRVELPLAYTEGFSPRPKVSFGLALPTGHESLAEYLDLELACAADEVDVVQLPHRLSAALPVGVDVAAVTVTEKGASLQEEVTSCGWEVSVGGVPRNDPAALAALVDAALASPALVVTREKKGQVVTDDIRPAVLSAAVVGPDERGILLVCELTTQPRSVRPSELLLAVGGGCEELLARRTHQWIERDGARTEPLVAAPAATGAGPEPLSVAVGAPHAMERAS